MLTLNALQWQEQPSKFRAVVMVVLLTPLGGRGAVH